MTASRPQRPRPKKSVHLERLEREISTLNDVYWGSLAGSHCLTHHRPPKAKTAADFLPEGLASRLDPSVDELDQRVSSLASRFRRLMLVDAVAVYEAFLLDRLKPVLGAATAKKCVDASYKGRVRVIYKALAIPAANRGTRHSLDIVHLRAACEVRNCLVHGGGMIDGRAVQKLRGFYGHGTLTVGQQLPLGEAELWLMLGALRAHARDLDLTLRTLSRRRRP